MTRRTYREHRSAEYQRLRRRLLGLPCWRCGKPATSADHVPPLAEWYRTHAEPWQGELRPSCGPCQYVDGGWRLANRLRRGSPAPSAGSKLWR